MFWESLQDHKWYLDNSLMCNDDYPTVFPEGKTLCNPWQSLAVKLRKPQASAALCVLSETVGTSPAGRLDGSQLAKQYTMYILENWALLETSRSPLSATAFWFEAVGSSRTCSQLEVPPASVWKAVDTQP